MGEGKERSGDDEINNINDPLIDNSDKKVRKKRIKIRKKQRIDKLQTHNTTRGL